MYSIADDDDDLNVDDDDRNNCVDQMEQILLQKFLYHEYNVDEQVKHDQHHHNPKKRIFF
jgi:hypothetical protein